MPISINQDNQINYFDSREGSSLFQKVNPHSIDNGFAKYSEPLKCSNIEYPFYFGLGFENKTVNEQGFARRDSSPIYRFYYSVGYDSAQN